MSKYLPPVAKGVTYSIQNNAKDAFASEDLVFMQEIATKMAVDDVADIGRIPSIMSRAYNFYIDLFPEQFAGGGAEQRTGRAEAHQRARRSLRGIITLLALRDALGLTVELRKFSSVGAPGTGTAPKNPYRAVFADAYQESPEFGKPGTANQEADDSAGAAHGPGAAAWRELRYLVVLTPVGIDQSGKHEFAADPLCGLSPFTLFFPAGRPMKHCKNIFWYDNASGEWLDPTTDWKEGRDSESPSVVVDYRIIKSLRGCLIRWLELVLKPGPQILWTPFGLRDNRANKLQEELTAWLGQLRKLDFSPPPQTFRLEAAPLLVDKTIDGRKSPLLTHDGKEVIVPILEHKAVWADEARSTLPGLVSELPRALGRVLLSNKILRDRNVRVCGRLVGNAHLTASLQDLPPEGEGFIVHQGEQTFVVPEPYLIVDKLFLENIHLIADDPIADRFSAMTARDSKDGHWWLFPFQPELLRYLDLDGLREKGGGQIVSCSRTAGAGKDIIEVTVFVGGVPFSREYDAKDKAQFNRDMAGNALDVRIWPNFRFPTKPRLPALDADRVHYFRVRQQAAWELKTKVLARKVKGPELSVRAAIPGSARPAGSGATESADDECAVQVFAPKNWDPGWPDELDSAAVRLARSFAFPGKQVRRAEDLKNAEGEWEPVGLVFQNRGFFLFSLEEPTPAPQGHPTPFKVGVDFGTSNTCVAAAVDSSGVEAPPKEIRFEVQTASLHRNPTYEDFRDFQAQGLPTEGAASVLDFPYKFGRETFLHEAAYFPTQLVTKLPNGAEPDGRQFLFSNGLIFARNLLGNRDFVTLLQGFPPLPPVDRRPFRLVHDPKWKNLKYRKPFLWHLYKMITYHSARNCAEIKSASFSFPRAFTKDMVEDYRTELRTVFHDHGRIQFELMTESDAVQRWMEAEERNAHPLVVDVGGGSTDVLGLFQQHKFQASYEFAAGLVNRYFSASPRFQRAFKEAIDSVVGTPDGVTPEEVRRTNQHIVLDELYAADGDTRSSPADYSEQAFFLMLNLVDEEHYPAIVDHLQSKPNKPQYEADRKSIAGFFHTLVLLYTGIVYQAGRLMRQHGVVAANIDARLIGNGSRFYHFLEHDNIHFSKVMAAMFYAGYGSRPGLKLELTRDGKTFVAKGLLVTPATDRAVVTNDLESSDYLMKLARITQPVMPVMPSFPDLTAFLTALNRELPGGRLDETAVIPYCGLNLATEMEKGLFHQIITAVFEREGTKARQMKAAWDQSEELARANPGAAAPVRESALATEPVFIIRLKCLIEQIRESYALGE